MKEPNGVGSFANNCQHYLGMCAIVLLFRAIFDLSNKIALLILLRMYALYVKQKFEKKKAKNWAKVLKLIEKWYF